MKVIFLVDDFVIEPLGIGYLSSVLKAAGHDVDLYKTYGKISIPNGLRELCGEKLVFAYSVTTGTHQYYIALNDLVKSYFKNSIAVFGGPHPTYFPEILEEENIDYILRGEAEKSFPLLLNALDKNETFMLEGVSDLIEDLDTIPLPDRDLIYKYDTNRNNPIKSVMTMRGCPFNCTYCYNVLYKQLYLEKKQKLVRFRGADNIIKECQDLQRFPLEMIYFQDDEFTANPNFRELMLLYKEKIKVPFHAQLRIDTITEKKTILLKAAGCIGVTFAIESGSEKIRRELLNRKVTNAQIFKGVALLKKYNIKFRIENMIGIPTETIEDIIETLKINAQCKPDVAWTSIFQPYPRLGLGNKCIELGLWQFDIDKFSPNFFDRTELHFGRKHARFINNTQKFFGFLCRHKSFIPFVRILSYIPENKYFKVFYHWYKQRGYSKLYQVSKEEECQKKKFGMKLKQKLLWMESGIKAWVPRFSLKN